MRVRQTANSRGQLPTLSGQHACAKQTANAGRVRAATDDVVRLSAIEMQREAVREFEAVSGSPNKLHTHRMLFTLATFHLEMSAPLNEALALEHPFD